MPILELQYSNDDNVVRMVFQTWSIMVHPQDAEKRDEFLAGIESSLAADDALLRFMLEPLGNRFREASLGGAIAGDVLRIIAQLDYANREASIG